MSDMPESTQATMLSPGQRLKAARLEAGMSLEDAAKGLFLTRHKLIALEEDDYSKLNSPVFVHGYIRKYAALLNIDGEALVADFNRLHPPPAEPELLQTRSLPASKGSKSWMPISGVAIAVALAFAVIMNSGNQEPSASLAQRETAPALESRPTAAVSTQAARDTLIAPETAASARANVDEVSAQVESEQTATQTAATTEAATTEAATPETASAENVLSIDESDASEVDSSTASSEPNRAPSAAADANQNASALPNPLSQVERPSTADQLAFAFLEECWLEVADASGDVIHTSIAKAGDTLALAGEAPFSIKLGNAHAVSLSLNGNSVDIDAQPGRRTHRLVVGE